MSNTSYVSQEDQTQVNLSTKGATKVAETITPFAQSLVRPKRKLDIKKVPNQTDDTPKTKRRYYYEKTQNYVSYARAKQLGLVK
jgi:hypothetical protein